MVTEVLTLREFSDLIQSNKKKNLMDKIKYFHYSDLDTCFAPQVYIDHLKFIVTHNKKEIIGICKFAYWDISKDFAISYICTHSDYRNKGVCKSITEELFKFFKDNYPNETLGISGYSIEGWKYLRKYILLFSQKYQVAIKEKPIEYVTDFSEENRRLFDESKEIITSK